MRRHERCDVFRNGVQCSRERFHADSMNPTPHLFEKVREHLVAGCTTCDRIRREHGGHGPSHDPSARCGSGKHTHCTCDTCF